MAPAALRAPVARESILWEQVEVVGVDLIFGKHERADLEASRLGDAARAAEVGGERFALLTWGVGEIVRVGVRTHLLAWHVPDRPEQTESVVRGVVVLTLARRVAVGRERRVVVGGAEAGREPLALVAVCGEEKADGRPCGGDTFGLEHREQGVDGSPGAVRIHFPPRMSHPPTHLEVQRHHEGSAASGTPFAGRKLLFVVNEAWFFLSHRLPLGLKAAEAGFEVHVAARDGGHGSRVAQHGFAFHPVRISRTGLNPLAELRALRDIGSVIRAVDPDVVHNVTVKPVLYASVLARATSRAAIVNAVSGFGYTYLGGSLSGRLVHAGYRAVASAAFRGPRHRVIFLNPDDRDDMVTAGLFERSQTRVIRGPGVRMDRFARTPQPEASPPLVVLPARMLWHKGVGEFVEAARLLQQWGVPVRMALVGGVDDDNPAGVPRRELEEWSREGIVEWWGYQEAMEPVYREAALVVLPSYREGLGRALIEAAASARPLIATDVPGCREIVRPGENGILVPAQQAEPLAAAIRTLVGSPDRRARMGQESRRIAVEDFSVEQVAHETFALYAELLASKPAQPQASRPTR